MTTVTTALGVFGILAGAILIGRSTRSWLPEHHLNADTRDTVKLAMGLVATMTALLLGLLVNSAKSAYDTERSEVIQMAAKVTFLEHLLRLYGSPTAEARSQLSAAVEDAAGQLWPVDKHGLSQLAAETQEGNALYFAIQRLAPQDDTQRNLKAQAISVAIELGQMRSLLLAQSVSSVYRPLVTMVVCWLVIILLGFSLVAPPNATATLALLVSALAASGAIFLILELDRPFGGLIQISNQPILNALNRFAK
ncbi:MAG TPA: hypothetical protein VMB80_18270 [Candidatus Acidoferrum sp.]|nr:hypothetical protein [Candidatus Acidoferrum sp.]